MSDHAETALDQLKLADDLAQSRADMHANALTAAQVHAQLALADAVLKAGLDPWAYAAQPRT
jgi:hypothetical protein